MFLLQLLLCYLCGTVALHRQHLLYSTPHRRTCSVTLRMGKVSRYFRIVKPNSLQDSEMIANQEEAGVQKDLCIVRDSSTDISIDEMHSRVATHVDSEARVRTIPTSAAPPISSITTSNQAAQLTDQIELNQTAAIEEEMLRLAVKSTLEAPDTLEPDDYVNTLRDTGVVRVNNVIQPESIFQLIGFIQAELADSIHAVTVDGVQHLDRFSNMLSSNNRWDLKLPLDNPIILDAIRKIFNRQTSVSKVLTSLVTERGELFELAAFCTSSGAARQVVHADTLWSKHPALYTCAIALQDVQEDMGPTLFLPGSHTKAVHKQFDSKKTKNDVLKNRSHVLSTLNMGDMSIYDSRVLHCGTANRSNKQRILLYATFKNPFGPSDDDDFWNVASIRPEYVGKYCLEDFTDC